MKKKDYKFLYLSDLSTEGFLAIWPSQYKFLINEFLIKKYVFVQNEKLVSLYDIVMYVLRFHLLPNLKMFLQGTLLTR